LILNAIRSSKAADLLCHNAARHRAFDTPRTVAVLPMSPAGDLYKRKERSLPAPPWNSGLLAAGPGVRWLFSGPARRGPGTAQVVLEFGELLLQRVEFGLFVGDVFGQIVDVAAAARACQELL